MLTPAQADRRRRCHERIALHVYVLSARAEAGPGLPAPTSPNLADPGPLAFETDRTGSWFRPLGTITPF